MTKLRILVERVEGWYFASASDEVGVIASACKSTSEKAVSACIRQTCTALGIRHDDVDAEVVNITCHEQERRFL